VRGLPERQAGTAHGFGGSGCGQTLPQIPQLLASWSVHTPLQQIPFPHEVSSSTGGFSHLLVVRLHVSVVQGLPSLHWLSLVQQPGIAGNSHWLLLHARVVQTSLSMQSVSTQHARHVPPQHLGVGPVHLFPQAPQLSTSVCRFLQLEPPPLPQQNSGAVQGTAVCDPLPAQWVA
jgi:hypothetical protein